MTSGRNKYEVTILSSVVVPERKAINDLSDELSYGYARLDVFGKTFLPESFSTPYSELHDDIFRLVNDSTKQKVAIAAPRNVGKTTIAKTLVERSILYRDYEFILYISNSEGVAAMQTENIKRELRTNRDIRSVFGDITISDDDIDDEIFSKKAWVAYGNTLVMPRGSGQQVRGLLYKNYRPQLIIVDDLEKKDELENPENRRKLKEWFYSDLLKCVDRYSDKWRIIYIDTLKHYESLLEELLQSEDWDGIRLDLCDDDYTSKVPYMISTEDLKKEAEAHRKKGQLDVFYMEYRNMPIAKEDASFQQQYFKYFDPVDIDKRNLEFVIIVDPAKTANMKSADSAIVGIGVDYARNALYVWDIVSGKFFPDELYNEMFEMRRRLNAFVIGVETTGLEEFIKQPITNEMQKRGPQDFAELIWLKARGGDPSGDKGKIKRISALVPFYRQGYVYHNRNCCSKLEAQLLSFPRSGLVDCADATAYIVEMLELGERYFTVPEEERQQYGVDEDGNIRDEFSELEYEAALEGDWRAA